MMVPFGVPVARATPKVARISGSPVHETVTLVQTSPVVPPTGHVTVPFSVTVPSDSVTEVVVSEVVPLIEPTAAVIVDVPALTAVTKPALLTVPTLTADELQTADPVRF